MPLFGRKKPVFQKLIEDLEDKEEEKQLRAARALSEVGEPAIPVLIETLGDAKKEAWAAVALKDMVKHSYATPMAVIPYLIKALGDKNKQAMAAALLKSSEFSRTAIEPLVASYLASSDENKKMYVYLTLKGISEDDFFQDQSTRQAASNALKQIKV